MDPQRLFNPYGDPMLGWLIGAIQWLILIGIPVAIFLLFFFGSWQGAKDGRLLAFSFVFGSIAYLGFVGLVGVGLQFSWLTIALFFLGTAVSFGRFELTRSALADAVLGGLIVALVGTLAVSGAGLVLSTGFAPHFVGWITACALVSIVAGVTAYVKGS
ncbi:hypothetical protein HYR54_15815 [Candidatus Acetothermia bacterium]|nr:hypothetical protein [Candidatus Acetothermia bacterium]